MLGARNPYQREAERANPLPVRLNSLGSRVALYTAIVRSRKPRHYGTKASVTAPNHLAQQFNVLEPNETWVMDITYIRTHEGWSYQRY